MLLIKIIIMRSKINHDCNTIYIIDIKLEWILNYKLNLNWEIHNYIKIKFNYGIWYIVW